MSYQDAARYPRLYPEWFLPPRPGFDQAAVNIPLGSRMHRASAVAFYGRRVVDACVPGEDGRYLERDLLEAILTGFGSEESHHDSSTHRRGVEYVLRPKGRRKRADDEGLTDLAALIAPVSGPTSAVS